MDYNDKKRIHIGYSCGNCAMDFRRILDEMNVPNNYLFVYHDPIRLKDENMNFNETYLMLIKNRRYEEADKFASEQLNILDRYSMVRHTHALIEILYGKEFIVIDPTVAVIYKTGKEELCRGKKIYESFEWMRQIEYHDRIARRDYSYLYATNIFWGTIYRISYNQQGDLP